MPMNVHFPPHPSRCESEVRDRVLRVTRRCYVILYTTLLSHRQTYNLRRKKNSAAATGTAAAWFYLIAAVLSPFAEVSR